MMQAGPDFHLGYQPMGTPPGLEYLAQLMCGEHSGAKWLPLHHPGGRYTLVVVEASFPLIIVKRFESPIDQILIHQKVELLEAFTGFETRNQYEIKNSLGQKIYMAKEHSNCCVRNCCGPLRRFDLKIKDNSGQEVIHLVRPWRCASCWFPCCLQEVEVQAPPGTTVGYVVQEWHPFLPRFSIQGASRETLLKLEGPCIACNFCSDVTFELMGKDGSQSIGRISKQWSGLLKEAFTDTDNFGIQFPMDLDVKMKAVLMGACFLIDFMFFERVGGGNQRNTVFS